MTITLQKGANLLLADEAPGIERVRVGLGWAGDAVPAAVELQGLLSIVRGAAPQGALLLAHQVPNPEESATAHLAAGPVVGDADKLVVTLAAIPADVSRVVFGLSIYDAVQRKQAFRLVRGAYVRVLNDANGLELARFTASSETGSETVMLLGELYRNPRGWKFRAVGQGYTEGLRAVTGGGADVPTVRPLDVTGYLKRISPARSRRNVAEYLNPPPLPPPSPPSPPARSKPVPASRPVPQSPRPSAPPPAPRPARPPLPARPAPTPAASRQPMRSALDLSAPEAQPDAPGWQPSKVEYGEHSSRHRQRMEHVSALDDDHPATTWTEQKRGSGSMTVILRWEPLHTAAGLPRPSDLQLGAFWQADDGAAGVVQTLGHSMSAPGALGPRQVLRLGRRDEREGQTLFVDLPALATFRRFFVFAYGQHGSPEWEALRPTLTVSAPSGEELTMRIGEAPPSARLCVVASFHVVAEDLIIRRENDFLEGLQADAAARYGWTLEWNPDQMTVRSLPG